MISIQRLVRDIYIYIYIYIGVFRCDVACSGVGVVCILQYLWFVCIINVRLEIFDQSILEYYYTHPKTATWYGDKHLQSHPLNTHSNEHVLRPLSSMDTELLVHIRYHYQVENLFLLSGLKWP